MRVVTNETTRRRYLETRDAIVQARVTPAELARWHRQAARVGVTLAEAVREGTRLYLRQRTEDVREDDAGEPTT